MHWVWSITHPNEGLRHLFPWTRKGMRHVFHQLRTAIRDVRLPPGGPVNDAGGLAGLINGFGLLAITAIAIIGGTFYLSRMFGATSGSLDTIEDVHDTFAVIVWIYWCGHLAVTVLHSLLHQPVWKRMFNLAA